MYQKVRRWMGHKHAQWLLYGASFVESIISPIPPDLLLAPMVVARPQAAWRLALGTTLASVLGALGGYWIGAYFMEAFGNDLIALTQLTEEMAQFQGWLKTYGAIVILICAVSPIPYKAVAITSGIVAIDLWVFILVGLMGRGARFFAVAAICKKWGAAAEAFILKKIASDGMRDVVALSFLVSILMLGGVFFFEFVKGLPPCQLCLWQRIPYYAVAGISFIALMLFTPKIYYGAAVLSGALFMVSAGLGAYHFGIELGLWAGFSECSGGLPLAQTPQELLNQLATAKPIDCAQPQWSLLGISLAGYNMLFSLGFGSFIFWRLYAQGNR